MGHFKSLLMHVTSNTELGSGGLEMKMTCVTCLMSYNNAFEIES